ncbi:hypothetical protein [Fusibacter bizertensis]
MRITSSFAGNYTSAYQSLAQTSTADNSESSSYSASSALLANNLFGNAKYSSSDTTAISAKDVTDQMSNDPRAMEMRMRMNSLDETSEASRERMKSLMDSIASSDLESMSEEEKRSLLEDVTSTMAELKGESGNAVNVSELSSEEVNSMLSEIQTKAIEGPQGKGGPGGPGGPPPGGKPSSVSGTDSESNTLQALLDALEADEADESTSDDEASETNNLAVLQNAFKTAINEYMKSQNWDREDLKSMFEG